MDSPIYMPLEYETLHPVGWPSFINRHVHRLNPHLTWFMHLPSTSLTHHFFFFFHLFFPVLSWSWLNMIKPMTSTTVLHQITHIILFFKWNLHVSFGFPPIRSPARRLSPRRWWPPWLWTWASAPSQPGRDPLRARSLETGRNATSLHCVWNTRNRVVLMCKMFSVDIELIYSWLMISKSVDL